MPGVMYMYAFIASDATRGMSSLDACEVRMGVRVRGDG